jgi:hypothetical protein
MNYPLSRKKFHIPQRAIQGRRSTEGDRVDRVSMSSNEVTSSLYTLAGSSFEAFCTYVPGEVKPSVPCRSFAAC